MPVEPIVTDTGEWKYIHPTPIVYTADTLEESAFEEVPYLRVARIDITAAPEIDHAELHYEFGRIFREDGTPPLTYDPLDIVGKFVKIHVPATMGSDDDLTWYGVIETNVRTFDGTGDTLDTQTGVQTFLAFGVLRLLDKQPILKTFIDEGEADPLEIPIGLPFNTDEHGAIASRGNRSDSLFTDSETDEQHFVFSDKARGAETWNAYEAIAHLLARHAPVDAGQTPANGWKIDDSVTSTQIDWYNISVRTHGRTVKAVLDELIPRQRGVGYYAKFEPSDNTCRLHVFSFADQDITLPGGDTLKANTDLRSLDFDQAVDIEQCHVSDVTGGTFHRVIVEGERRTTTFTQPLASPITYGSAFEPDWNLSEEEAYADGASAQSWYDPLDEQAKELANAAARANQKRRHVFARFRMRKEGGEYRNRPFFAMPTGQNGNGPDKEYYPAFNLSGDNAEADDTFVDRESYGGNPVWVNGVRFLRTLPLFDRYDYSGTNIAGGAAAWKVGVTGLQDDYDQPDFMKPFAFARIASGDNADADRFVPLDRLHETAFNTDNGRHWSVGLEVSTTDPAILLKVHPQQFIAKTRWNDRNPAATSDEHDPNVQGGLDPEDIWVTITAEIPERVKAERVLEAPAAGVGENVLRIEAEDCRCDWVCPYTVVEIRNGQMTKTTSGGFVRDDRNRLKDIARAAAEWYGRPRQTLKLTYRTLRNLFQPGWLITEFGSFQRTNVNTVITAVRYDFGNGQQPGKTTIETSFAQLDVL